MKQMTQVVVAMLQFLSAIALGQGTTVDLKEGNQISAQGSSLLALESAVGTTKVAQDVPVPPFQNTLVFSAPVIKAISNRLSANPAATNALLLKDSAGRELARFTLGSTGAAVSAGSPSVAVEPTPRQPALAGRVACRAAASAWQASNAEEWNGGKDALLVLFNRDARGCYESTQFPRQGDTVFVGVVATDDDDIESAAVQFSSCSREPVEPNVYVPGNPRDFVTQSGGFHVRIVEVRRCWDKEITLTVNVKPAGANAAEGTRPISFFERFRGTIQLGVLYTDLHENDFGLRQSDGQSVIYNKESVNKGPEYTASLVVYGFPKYFTHDGWTKGYRGRDILNDHAWADRTGLVILAGLGDPGARFGVGLSFELAYGINLVVAKQWFRQKELVGLSEGDVFTGDATSITTRKNWETDTSVGLSFDLRYIKALFQGQ